VVDPALPDDLPGRELAEIPSVEVISRAAVLLMSAAAERLGLGGPGDPVDLDDAGPLRDGLRSLQLAFREASPWPDEPGQGPGERLTGAVYPAAG